MEDRNIDFWDDNSYFILWAIIELVLGITVLHIIRGSHSTFLIYEFFSRVVEIITKMKSYEQIILKRVNEKVIQIRYPLYL